MPPWANGKNQRVPRDDGCKHLGIFRWGWRTSTGGKTPPDDDESACGLRTASRNDLAMVHEVRLQSYRFALDACG